MRAGTAESYYERVQRVLVHIQSNLDGPLSLDDLAAIANFSPYHFHRVFRGIVGEPVKEHVRRLRLERAARRLRYSDALVADVAFEAGYESHEAFTRAFAASFGESPSAYRERRAPWGNAPSEGAGPAGALGPFPAAPAGARFDAQIKRIGPLRVAFARHVGPYGEVSEAWQRIMQFAVRRGIIGPNLRTIGIVHDDYEVTPEAALRYDAAVAVPDSIRAEGDIGVQEIPAGDYAVAMHRGPYHLVSGTYGRLCGEWLASAGREPAAAPALEIYRNSPFCTGPEDLLTEIHVPLA